MGEDLITKKDYKKYAGISSNTQDQKIDILIPKISQFIKNYCRRTFIDYAFDYKTDIFHGGWEYLLLQEDPILEIQSVSVSEDLGRTYAEVDEYDYWILDGYKIRPTTSTTFTEMFNGYKVVYRAGYEELPEDVLLACMDMVSYYMKNDGTVKAVKFTNTSTMQTEFISDIALPSYIRRILDNYVLDYT